MNRMKKMNFIEKKISFSLQFYVKSLNLTRKSVYCNYAMKEKRIINFN